MTISDFARQPQQAALRGRTVRQRYRDLKRLEAEERQARFDAEVAKVAREQNCHPNDARYIVRSRYRVNLRRAQVRAR